MLRRVLACLVFIIGGASAEAQESWIGQSVFWKSGAKAMVGARAIDIALIDFPATVGKVNGDWLWLERAWVRASDVYTPDQALVYYNDQIRRNPRNADAYRSRGSVWTHKVDLNNALADFTESLRLDPASKSTASTYNNRGNVWLAKGELDNGLKDYTEAIRVDPAKARAYYNRGRVWKAKHEFDNALKDYAEAIRLDPADAWPYNNIAWLRATCPDAKYRDGAEAVRMAIKVRELRAVTDSNQLDTLAAAYAEAGEFDKAVEWQEKAIQLAPEKADYQSRVDLYRAKQPFREK